MDARQSPSPGELDDRFLRGLLLKVGHELEEIAHKRGPVREAGLGAEPQEGPRHRVLPLCPSKLGRVFGHVYV